MWAASSLSSKKKRRACVFNKVIPLWKLSFAIIRAVKIDAMRWDGTAADFVRERRKRREKGASSWSPTRNLVLYETRDVMRNWIPIGRIEFPLEWVWTFDGFELHLGSSIHSPRLQTMRHQVEIGGSQKQLQKEFNNLNNAPLLVEIKNRTIFSSFDPFHPLHSLPIVNRYFILTGAVKKKKKKRFLGQATNDAREAVEIFSHPFSSSPLFYLNHIFTFSAQVERSER